MNKSNDPGIQVSAFKCIQETSWWDSVETALDNKTAQEDGRSFRTESVRLKNDTS